MRCASCLASRCAARRSCARYVAWWSTTCSLPGVKDTTGDNDQFCNPGGNSSVGCSSGPAPGHIPPCVGTLTNGISSYCGSPFSDDADHLHRLVVPAGITLVTASTCNPVTVFDTLLVFYRENGANGEVAGCFDQPGCPLGTGQGDTGTIAVTPGEVLYILVDGFSSGSRGTYELVVTGS